MAAAHEHRRDFFAAEHRLADGTIRDAEVYCAPIEIGSRTLLHSVVHDVSTRRLAEDALRESEEHFRVLYELSPIAVETYDHEGRLMGVDPACLELFGISDDLDLPGFDLFADPNLPAEHKERLRHCGIVHSAWVMGGASRPMTESRRHCRGERLWSAGDPEDAR